MIPSEFGNTMTCHLAAVTDLIVVLTEISQQLHDGLPCPHVPSLCNLEVGEVVPETLTLLLHEICYRYSDLPQDEMLSL